MSIKVRRFDGMPPNRPSRYCLAMQDDSVFADFDMDQDGRIFLLRISFDGYGCCEATTNVQRMSPDTSKRFAALISSNEVSSRELADMLSTYFRENIDLLWKDALKHHNLI